MLELRNQKRMISLTYTSERHGHEHSFDPTLHFQMLPVMYKKLYLELIIIKSINKINVQQYLQEQIG